jgi:hypothetical protein
MRSVLLATAAMLAAPPPGLGAEEALNPTLNERVTFQVGAHWANFDKEKVSSQQSGGGREIKIDLKTLGVDDDYTSPYFNFIWRPTRRFQTMLSYFGTRNSGTRVLDADITFDDVTFPADTSLHTEFEFDVYLVNLGYSVFRTERLNLGVGGGVHVVDIEVSFEGRGQVGDGPSIDFAEANEDVLAPVPNLVAYGGYAFSPRLALQGGLGWLSLSYGKYDGRLLTLSGSLEYRFHKNFGIGAGYRYFDLELDIDGSNFDHSIDLNIDGPFVYAVAGF